MQAGQVSDSGCSREALARWIDESLEVSRFADYCPNGLQVEGSGRIRRMVGGVTASLALVDAAVERGADAILVHHGWFWRGEDPRVVGTRRERLKRLLAHDINLFAYHLPLDAHPAMGNNAQLARVLEWTPQARFGKDGIGMLGVPSQGDPASEGQGPLTASEIARRVAERLGRVPLLVGDPDRPVRRVAWCTGAAQSWLQEAIDAGADLYLSGEISEPTVHLAREAGVAYLAAGHHATERYGVQALGRAAAAALGIDFEFVDIDNPA